jgi:hypothetical protein
LTQIARSIPSRTIAVVMADANLQQNPGQVPIEDEPT